MISFTSCLPVSTLSEASSSLQSTPPKLCSKPRQLNRTRRAPSFPQRPSPVSAPPLVPVRLLNSPFPPLATDTRTLPAPTALPLDSRILRLQSRCHPLNANDMLPTHRHKYPVQRHLPRLGCDGDDVDYVRDSCISKHYV